MPTISHPTNRANFTFVELGAVTYAFSYRTCVGVHAGDGRGWIVRVNEWGPTTGAHLNYLDRGDKSARVDASTFAQVCAELVERAQ